MPVPEQASSNDIATITVTPSKRKPQSETQPISKRTATESTMPTALPSDHSSPSSTSASSSSSSTMMQSTTVTNTASSPAKAKSFQQNDNSFLTQTNTTEITYMHVEKPQNQITAEQHSASLSAACFAAGPGSSSMPLEGPMSVPSKKISEIWTRRKVRGH
ncbi:uncharacterized protein VTP21DRAFT_4538 [Calcarisporiella thermophila]|uniref:uncharacterized protein n=1 Tax=Calcarisporiella thermophila TaxID=911321 RepID=UPI0037421F65